jgi:hypothetical protein
MRKRLEEWDSFVEGIEMTSKNRNLNFGSQTVVDI